MKLLSLDELLEEQLQDIYTAEVKLSRLMPDVRERCSSSSLKQSLETHIEETKDQLNRLSTIADSLDLALKEKQSPGVAGLVQEVQAILQADGDEDIIDCALIAATQRAEHYEICCYGSARALAEHLGYDEIVELLQESLDEEYEMDKQLTGISEEEIIPQIESEHREELEEETRV